MTGTAATEQIATMVATLRDSIAIEEAGQTITYPFEIATARRLFTLLMGPVASELASVNHLVFEPDGALLTLPANLLVMDDESVTRYEGRQASADADPYDFRGTAWLGRAMTVTTAVSPAGFRDVRRTRASNAGGEYLGLGQNLPLGEGAVQTGGTRGGVAGDRCTWAPVTWGNPISAAELRTVSRILGADGKPVELLTEGQFTDTRLKQMQNLNDFRIVHFATHGLVTAPQPGCKPSPPPYSHHSLPMPGSGRARNPHIPRPQIPASTGETAKHPGIRTSKRPNVHTSKEKLTTEPPTPLPPTRPPNTDRPSRRSSELRVPSCE